jgi:hypothetical protein
MTGTASEYALIVILSGAMSSVELHARAFD